MIVDAKLVQYSRLGCRDCDIYLIHIEEVLDYRLIIKDTDLFMEPVDLFVEGFV